MQNFMKNSWMNQILAKETDNMTYEEFKEAVRESAAREFGDSAEVYLKTVTKINDTEREAVTVGDNGKETESAVYLDDLYQAYRSTGRFDKCVEKVIRICREQSGIRREDFPGTWEEAKPGIQMRVINKEWNRKYLKQMPSKYYLNFAIVFCVVLEETGEMSAAVSVTDDIMRRWGVNVEMLWHTALDNIRKEVFRFGAMDVVLESMCRAAGLGTDSLKEQMPFEKGICPLYVATSENQSYGARVILRADLLREFAEKRKSDFFILPSSVHELIFVEDDGKMDAGKLKRMVCDINRQPGTIAPEDRLSDLVYYYDRKKDFVEIVA